MCQHPEFRFGVGLLGENLAQQFDRLLLAVITQAKRPIVDRHADLGANNSVGLDSLFGPDVDPGHEPTWTERPNRQHR